MFWKLLKGRSYSLLDLFNSLLCHLFCYSLRFWLCKGSSVFFPRSSRVPRFARCIEGLHLFGFRLFLFNEGGLAAPVLHSFSVGGRAGWIILENHGSFWAC